MADTFYPRPRASSVLPIRPEVQYQFGLLTQKCVGGMRTHVRERFSTMESGSDMSPVTRSRAVQSQSTGSRSRAGISAAPSTPDKFLKSLEDRSVHKSVSQIVGQDGGVENRIKCAVNDALAGSKVWLAILNAVAEAHTQATVVNALVDARNDHEGYLAQTHAYRARHWH